MTKLEKVICSLERCTCHVPDACQDCAYDIYPYPVCNQKLDRDALELLKEQELKEPTQEAQRDYEAASDVRDYCERHEPTYNPDDGSM